MREGHSQRSGEPLHMIGSVIEDAGTATARPGCQR